MAGIDIDAMAETIMTQLNEYANLATDGMKEAVQKTAKECREEIKAAAPRGERKTYYKSWKTSTTEENANNLHITVYSSQYWLPHLLEHGHALRNGGRARAFPHIATAAENAKDALEERISDLLGG